MDTHLSQINQNGISNTPLTLLWQDMDRFQREQLAAQRKTEREATKEFERQLKEEAKLRVLQERTAKKEAADAEREVKKQQRIVLKGLSRACVPYLLSINCTYCTQRLCCPHYYGSVF